MDDIPETTESRTDLDLPTVEVKLPDSLSQGLSKFFEKIGPLLEALAEMLQPIMELVEDEEFKSWRDSLAAIGEGMMRQMSSVSELAQGYGWAVPMQTINGVLYAMLQDGATQEEVDALLVERFSPGGNGYDRAFRVVAEVDGLEHRLHIIAEAKECAEEGKHYAAVTLLMQSVEGIMIDWLYENGDPAKRHLPPSPSKQGTPLMRQKLSGEIMEPLGEAAMALLGAATGSTTIFDRSVLQDVPEMRSSPRLLRHTIAHGVACQYGTGENVAKAVALLGFVAELMAALRPVPTFKELAPPG